MAKQRVPTLNTDQHTAYDAILNAVETQSGQCFFLNGPGGTGKTYIYNTLCYTLCAGGKIIICTASSGITAVLLIGGCTTHFRFRIPINLHEGSSCGISKNLMEADLLHETSLIIIIDEITMQHCHAAEAIDKLLQDIRWSDRPFGGVSVVFGGDFQQILPVIVKGSRPQIVGACIQRSSIWRHLQILNLTINMCLQAAQDPEERGVCKVAAQCWSWQAHRQGWQH